MTANSQSAIPSARLWRMIYQAQTRIDNALDQLLRERELTSEQCWVLMILRYTNTPPRIVDIADYLERSPNSVSNLVDRMVKAGLVRRTRDRKDRRIVKVFMTSKAENALEPAARAVWKLMELCISPLSHEDKTTFASLFNAINYKLLGYLNPGADIEGMFKIDSKRHDHFLKEWRKHAEAGITEAKQEAGKKRKTARRI